METQTKIVLMLILSAVVLFGIILLPHFLPKEKSIGDCYDREGNKIIGQSCEIEEISDSWQPILILSAAILLALMLILTLSLLEVEY